MDHLEDSTLDLIYRRRVRSFYPGYVVMAMVMGAMAALPLVKVDVVTTTAGMVRPLQEPVGVISPITGILDSTILRNNQVVTCGDTLAWIRRDHPEAMIREYQEQIVRNLAPARDIRRILDGEEPRETGRYIQSFRNHLAALSRLQIRKEFLQGEYRTASELFEAAVIPQHEYEEAASEYLLACAQVNDLLEGYRDQLEEQLYLLEQENRTYRRDIILTRSRLQDYFIVAPVSGTIHNSPGLETGSVIQSGMTLGSVSPSGNLVAEIFLDPSRIHGISRGTRVHLRFEGSGIEQHARLEASVDQIEQDVTLVNGKPAYRIRCNLDSPCMIQVDGQGKPVMKGMTFSASLVLFRRPLSSLIVDRVNRWANPAGPDLQP